MVDDHPDQEREPVFPGAKTRLADDEPRASPSCDGERRAVDPLAGSSALCVSTFPMISNFGITTVIAVGFGLIGAIVAMPAALVEEDRVQTLIEHRREARASAAAGSARPSFYLSGANDRS